MSAAGYITARVEKNCISEAEQENFRDMAEAEHVSLHEGNFAGYHIRPSEFEAWQQGLGRAQETVIDTSARPPPL
jgi:hypothetical protein